VLFLQITFNGVEIELQIPWCAGPALKATDAPFPLARFRCLLRAKVIKTRSAVSVEYAQRPFFFLEVVQT